VVGDDVSIGDKDEVMVGDEDRLEARDKVEDGVGCVGMVPWRA